MVSLRELRGSSRRTSKGEQKLFLNEVWSWYDLVSTKSLTVGAVFDVGYCCEALWTVILPPRWSYIVQNQSESVSKWLSRRQHLHCWYFEVKSLHNFPLQFFSVTLAHLSDQNWKSPNYLFSVHIIVSFVHIKKAVSHFFDKVANALVHPCKWLCTFVVMWMRICGPTDKNIRRFRKTAL